MRRLLIILIACVHLASVPVVSGAATERRIALVIGNSNYMDAPLRNPVNDATDMASALKELGFSVTLKTDANQRAMEESIRAFGDTLRSGDVGLFYYAGHGIQHRGTNYLIPVHSEIKSEADVKYEAVNAGRVLAQMERAGNGLNIIILDACRNNPFARSFRSAEKGLAKMDAPTGSILAYATAPGSIAADGIGRNGLYTEKLLKHMTTPNMKIETVFKKVRIAVANATDKKQTPWESSSLMGDFYFNLGKAASNQSDRAIAVEKRKVPQTYDAEEEMWGVVRESSVVVDYYRFLDEYPNGRFSKAAKLKVQQLKRRRNDQRITASVAPRNSDKNVSEGLKELRKGKRLVLFPVKAINNLGSSKGLKEWTVRTVRSVFNREDRLEFEVFPENGKDIWKRKTIFSRYEPDWEQIRISGGENDADLALVIWVYVDSNPLVDVYIYDLKKDKLYSRRNRSISYSDVSGGIEQNTLIVMKEYFKNQ